METILCFVQQLPHTFLHISEGYKVKSNNSKRCSDAKLVVCVNQTQTTYNRNCPLVHLPLFFFSFNSRNYEEALLWLSPSQLNFKEEYQSSCNSRLNEAFTSARNQFYLQDDLSHVFPFIHAFVAFLCWIQHCGGRSKKGNRWLRAKVMSWFPHGV